MWCKCAHKGWSVIACSSLTICSGWKIMCMCVLMCIKQVKMTSAKVIPSHWMDSWGNPSRALVRVTLLYLRLKHIPKFSSQTLQLCFNIMAKLSFAERNCTGCCIDLTKEHKKGPGVKVFGLWRQLQPIVVELLIIGSSINLFGIYLLSL